MTAADQGPGWFRGWCKAVPYKADNELLEPVGCAVTSGVSGRSKLGSWWSSRRSWSGSRRPRGILRTVESGPRSTLFRENPISPDLGVVPAGQQGSPGLSRTWVLLVPRFPDFSVSFLAHTTHHANPSALVYLAPPQSPTVATQWLRGPCLLQGRLQPKLDGWEGTPGGQKAGLNGACLDCKALAFQDAEVPWRLHSFLAYQPKGTNSISSCAALSSGRFKVSKIHL